MNTPLSVHTQRQWSLWWIHPFLCIHNDHCDEHIPFLCVHRDKDLRDEHIPFLCIHRGKDLRDKHIPFLCIHRDKGLREHTHSTYTERQGWTGWTICSEYVYSTHFCKWSITVTLMVGLTDQLLFYTLCKGSVTDNTDICLTDQLLFYTLCKWSITVTLMVDLTGQLHFNCSNLQNSWKTTAECKSLSLSVCLPAWFLLLI